MKTRTSELQTVSIMAPGVRLNMKISSYQYRDSQVKDKTASPTVLSLTWESPYLGKMVFIHVVRLGPDYLVTQGSRASADMALA